jgi:hypothetical protein
MDGTHGQTEGAMMANLDKCAACGREMRLGNTGAFNVEADFALCMDCFMTTKWNNRELVEDIMHKAAQWDIMLESRTPEQIAWDAEIQRQISEELRAIGPVPPYDAR